MNKDVAAVAFPSRVGVWWNSEPWPIREAQSIARDIETLGFGSLFIPEGGGKDALVESAAFLAATNRLVIGTGIANIHFRLPAPAEAGARTLTALHPQRFVLGLGVSHAPFVEESMRGSYGKPLATMRTYLERMDSLPAGIEEGIQPVRLLAALGPKMVQLSGELADGAHPYCVTPEHTAASRAILGPDKWLIPEQAIAIGHDADELVQRARIHLGGYLELQNYRSSLLRQGFDESDLARGGSDRLIRALIAIGGPEDAAAQITAHLNAGADHVVVQIVGDELSDDPRPALRQLANMLPL